MKHTHSVNWTRKLVFGDVISVSQIYFHRVVRHPVVFVYFYGWTGQEGGECDLRRWVDNKTAGTGGICATCKPIA